MRMNCAGEMITGWWSELGHKFPNVVIDACAVMPNHMHGIVIIHPVGADLRVCPVTPSAEDTPKYVGAGYVGAHAGAPLQTHAPLPQIVQWFKTMTTNTYIRGVKDKGWPPFHRRLWQRNYYEHVVRNEEELNLVRQYIADNPLRWPQDPENPSSPP